MKEISFTVPLIPPSCNHYVKHTRKGRHYVTKEAQDFKLLVAYYGKGHAIHAEAYSVSAAIYLGHGKRGDIDNFAKCLLDSLVSARVIHSDAAVEEITLRKRRDRKNPRTEITVKAI